MKLGIVGLGRSGKSTLFNALANRNEPQIQSGNQAVPVLEVVNVPETRVDWLMGLYQPKKTTYATVTYMDLQGMPGMADNKKEYMSLLLNHVRPLDAIIMVVRNFNDDLLGAPQAAADYAELEDEFLIADLATVEKRLERIATDKQRGKKVSEKEKAFLNECSQMLNDGLPLRSKPGMMDDPDFRGFTFLTAKPLLVIANNEDDSEDLPGLELRSADSMVVRGKIEMEMIEFSAEEKQEFLEDYGISESALDRVIKKSYEMLKLGSFLTVGSDEVRAWTIPLNTHAKRAAGAVHSDIEKGFIRAEVVAYDDLKAAGDHAAAKQAGKVRLEGKTYPVKDGDIINFRFNI